MFDLASYYSTELERISKSPGCSEPERDAIKAEIALRKKDPTRELGYDAAAEKAKKDEQHTGHGGGFSARR